MIVMLIYVDDLDDDDADDDNLDEDGSDDGARDSITPVAVCCGLHLGNHTEHEVASAKLIFSNVYDGV
jgi:hypothetical protein